ncbi:MAG: ArsJ-associated glyceraldehyde-3-phosphate dehydrogenase [Gammaproteobacteria bacterium]|nr:ArsJ-associated glyceraldehyde-3-phosphate dehydrogenase [Gammaproteobacteria bacterium]
MSIRVGINGFGRMGRLGLRAGWDRAPLAFTQINEIACDALGAAHLLEFDSVHGRWPKAISSSAEHVHIGDQSLAYSHNADIAHTDWSNCDLVIEATGQFRTTDALQAYFAQGVKTVLVAAPVDGALNIVYGVNDHLYHGLEHKLITAASCTTNCLAPLVKVMHERIGVTRGCITTIHDITNTQTIVDKGHRDLRRARANGQSLIPTTTGSAKAITTIFPELQGKLDGLAVRVPLLNASLVDFVFETQRPVTVAEVNRHLRSAAENELSHILGYEERPLVSADFKGDPRSAVVDALSTMVIDGQQAKILAWYDNEWGYANRLMDIAEMVAAATT